MYISKYGWMLFVLIGFRLESFSRKFKGEDMGRLKAMAYRTTMFAKLADHTYVECGNGAKGWSCWGGKSGGRVLREGNGSTKRADKIAQKDEKANIKCYLINGVCHQAANRILFPAGITVRGARGYSISEALFGTYGRVGHWPCSSPFDQYASVTGDLEMCLQKPSKELLIRGLSDVDKLDRIYIKGVIKIYDRAKPLLKSKNITKKDTLNISTELFMYMADFHLGAMLDKKLKSKLKSIRQDTEKARLKLEKPLAAATKNVKKKDFTDFAKEFDKITLEFQDKMADVLTQEQYMTLFDLEPDERIILADPEIIASI